MDPYGSPNQIPTSEEEGKVTLEEEDEQNEEEDKEEEEDPWDTEIRNELESIKRSKGQKKDIEKETLIQKITKTKPEKHTGWDIYPSIELNEPGINFSKGFPSNRVYTTKYTIWNFIFKNLFEQFRRLTNFYFLLVTIVTLIPVLSPISPVTSILSLGFVLGVTALKEGYEDFKRYKQDLRVNNRKYFIVNRDGSRGVCRSQDIKVGDIIYIEKNQSLPADMVLLSSALKDGICYIETSQLDGESNLKTFKALKETSKLSVWKLKATIECEEPNPDLSSFSGRLVIDGKFYPLSNKQLLLRGTSLRNTPWVYGVVVYTGIDTKLRLNEKEPPSKFSTLDRTVNKYIVLLFSIEVVLIIIASALSGYFQRTSAYLFWYLGSYSLATSYWTAVLNAFAYFVLLSYIIPISLLITLEMSRTIQGKFMEMDPKMQSLDEEETTIHVKTTNLNDELALVKHICSDKTGTLTQNSMTFAKCSINGEKFTLEELIEQEEKEFENNSKRDPSPRFSFIVDFLKALSLCHSAIVEEEENELKYSSISPDEIALCQAAKKAHFEFLQRDNDEITISENKKKGYYKVLNILPFSSARARMSVIVKTSDNKIILFSKGADSIMYKRIKPSSIGEITQTHLNEFSKEGLRTLVIAKRELTESEHSEWNYLYESAVNSLHNRDQLLEEAAEKIELDLKLIGCTAIEDKLQEGVPQTINYLIRAGIKIYVITGDKKETAINIGYSTNLLQPNQKLISIDLENSPKPLTECRKQLQKAIDEVQIDETSKFALIIGGEALTFALNPDIQYLFSELLKRCESVICCRTSPLQKAQVVRVIKQCTDEVVLSIGDGANDVSMIQEAHIGIGLFGKEGSQAARASDFAIPQFRHLQRLITVHGRYNFIRNTMLIKTQLYKNAAFALVQFWYSWFCGFSSTSVYDDWVITFFNIIFTSATPFIISLFEIDISEESIEMYPKVYKYISDGIPLTPKTIFIWLLSALYHSIVCFFGGLLYCNLDVVFSDGQTGGLHLFTFFIAVEIIVVILTKIGFETHYWNSVMHFYHWGSFIVFFLSMLSLSSLSQFWPQGYYLFEKISESPSAYFVLILVIVVSLLPDFVFKYLKRTYFPTDWQLLQECEKFKIPFNVNPNIN